MQSSCTVGSWQLKLICALDPNYGKSVITVSVITVRNSVITVRNSDGVRQSGFTAVRSVITVRNYGP